MVVTDQEILRDGLSQAKVEDNETKCLDRIVWFFRMKPWWSTPFYDLWQIRSERRLVGEMYDKTSCWL
jgi:hypothetical protein